MNRKFIFIFLLILIPVVSAGYMFSTYSVNDTHIGQPGFFSNNITYDGTFNLTNESCGLQDFVIGMKSQNDSHISGNPNFYQWRLCSNDTECEVTTVCVYDAVGSLYKMNDSHWASSPDYFNFILCCERIGRDGGGANLTVSVGIVEEIIEEEEFIDVVKKLIEGNAFLFVMVLAIIVILIILFLCWFLFILLTRRRKKEEKN